MISPQTMEIDPDGPKQQPDLSDKAKSIPPAGAPNGRKTGISITPKARRSGAPAEGENWLNLTAEETPKDAVGERRRAPPNLETPVDVGLNPAGAVPLPAVFKPTRILVAKVSVAAVWPVVRALGGQWHGPLCE